MSSVKKATLTTDNSRYPRELNVWYIEVHRVYQSGLAIFDMVMKDWKAIFLFHIREIAWWN